MSATSSEGEARLDTSRLTEGARVAGREERREASSWAARTRRGSVSSPSSSFSAACIALSVEVAMGARGAARRPTGRADTSDVKQVTSLVSYLYMYSTTYSRTYLFLDPQATTGATQPLAYRLPHRKHLPYTCLASSYHVPVLYTYLPRARLLSQAPHTSPKVIPPPETKPPTQHSTPPRELAIVLTSSHPPRQGRPRGPR